VNNLFNFTINDFNGPLDLLLHLVKESKMDIYEVSIEEITSQYISIINEMEKLNIDVASEYLVVASELVHLKSKMLLNIKDKEEEPDEEGLGISNEEELRSRLIEYQKYKELTEEFKEMENKRSLVHTKIPESLNEYREEVKLNTDTTLDDLMEAFNNFLERQKYMKPLSTKVTAREISVDARSKEIRSILEKHKRVDFFDLFGEGNRPYLVVTFLSILEMTKNKEINIKQEKNFSNIIIEAK
jgi:segregation and condensation protein A